MNTELEVGKKYRFANNIFYGAAIEKESQTVIGWICATSGTFIRKTPLGQFVFETTSDEVEGYTNRFTDGIHRCQRYIICVPHTIECEPTDIMCLTQ